MAIDDPAETLQTFEHFLQKLRQYKELIGSHEQYDEAEALRSRLAQDAGVIGPDLDELQVSQQVAWHRNRMPVLESALTPVADPDSIVVQGQMLDMAIQMMENATGRARRLRSDRDREAAERRAREATKQAEEDARVGEPIVFPLPPDEGRVTKSGWFGIGLLLGAVGGYVWGRYRDQIWNAGLYAIETWPAWRKVTVTGLVAVALVIGSIVTNLVTKDGFDGMRKRPVYSVLMITVALAATIAATALSTP